MPVISEGGLSPLPKLQKHSSPDRHKNGEHHGAVVIERVRNHGVVTAGNQRPVRALSIAQWAHVEQPLVGLVADILDGLEVARVADAVQEHDETENGSRNQHSCVETEPGEVQPDFRPEIILDGVVRLELEATTKPRPLASQPLPAVCRGFALGTFLGTRMERVSCYIALLVYELLDPDIESLFTKPYLTADLFHHATSLCSTEERILVVVAHEHFQAVLLEVSHKIIAFLVDRRVVDLERVVTINHVTDVSAKVPFVPVF